MWPPSLALPLLLLMAQTDANPRYLQTEQPNIGFNYDYSYDIIEAKDPPPSTEATTVSPAPTIPLPDPLEEAREMARLNIMDRILIALGPPFGEKLPKAPISNTLATVQTPINITTEPCPYKYKRCSSQTYFPSCDIPRNTSPEIWPQKFNLFFNMSAADFDNKLDLINATLRLYKNTSLPLQRAKSLLVKAFVYTRSLTRRRSKYKLVADTQVSSDYIGWVTLSVTNMIKRWKRQKHNHGLLITVNDMDDTLWDAPRIFATMDCTSGLPPLPFEIQMEEFSQQYPALNIRLGSPDQEVVDTTTVDTSFASLPKPQPTTVNVTYAPTMQGDEPIQSYDYNYESDLMQADENSQEGDIARMIPDEQEFSVAEQRQKRPHERPVHPLYDFFTPIFIPSSSSPVPFTLTPQTMTSTTPTTPVTTTTTQATTQTPVTPQHRSPHRSQGKRRDAGRHRRRNRGGHKN